MIIPKKHISLSESIIGLSAIIYSSIGNKDNIDDIFARVKKDRRVPKSFDLDSIVMGLDFLFSIGLVVLTEDGGIEKCN